MSAADAAESMVRRVAQPREGAAGEVTRRRVVVAPARGGVIVQPLALVEGVVDGARQAQGGVIAGVLTDCARPLTRDGRTHAVAVLAARRLFPLFSVVAVSAIVAFCDVNSWQATPAHCSTGKPTAAASWQTVHASHRASYAASHAMRVQALLGSGRQRVHARHGVLATVCLKKSEEPGDDGPPAWTCCLRTSCRTS